MTESLAQYSRRQSRLSSCQRTYDNMDAHYDEDDFEAEQVIVARQISYHIARKDHYNDKGDKILVNKGELYRYIYERGYYLDEDNEPFDNYGWVAKCPFSKMQNYHKKQALEKHPNYKDI